MANYKETQSALQKALAKDKQSKKLLLQSVTNYETADVPITGKVSDELKAAKSEQKSFLDEEKSFNGLLRTVYKHFNSDFVEDNKFKSSFKAYDFYEDMKNAKTKDEFLTVLRTALYEDICPCFFGLDEDGNKVHGFPSLETVEFEFDGEKTGKKIFARDEEDNLIKTFVPVKNWNLRTLFRLFNEDKARKDKQKEVTEQAAPTKENVSAPKNTNKQGNRNRKKA